MLIAIAGSQGSGKTTILTALEELGYKTIKRKSSRSILDEWGVTLSEVNNNRELTVKFQDTIIKRKFDDEINAFEDQETIWFTERSFADFFTYALVALGKDNEYDEWITAYYDRAKTAQQIYDHVFYIEGGKFDVAPDGVRGVNQYYSTMVDMVMKHFTEEMDCCGLSFITEEGIEERVSQIVEVATELEELEEE